MGSDRLNEPDEGLQTWLRSLPIVTSDTEAIRVLGSIAGTIADHRRVPPPAALHADERIDIPAHLRRPDVLGAAWETIMADEDRRLQGSHFTPRTVADAVVAVAMPLLRTGEGAPTVWDPTCGGGAFLLAAARALEHRGHDRAEIVAGCHGTDIDPIALRVADASLELWADGRARPSLSRHDVLADTTSTPPEGRANLVVGNPPFLSQLAADTARTPQRRALLAERFGEAARGYVDDVGLIALAATRHAAPDAVVALVMPQSVLGAADAAGVRAALAADASLDAVWVETGGAFAASVDVAAPVFVRGGTGSRTAVHHGERTIDIPEPPASSWAPVLAAVQGVPMVEPASSSETVGQLAAVTAGFRQHFYGLDGAVAEAEPEPGHGVAPRLITSGAIEPLWCRWGIAPTAFAKRRWERPVVHLDRIEDADVAAWFAERMRPKILVASQTRVIEVVVDEAGQLLPSVPVISIEPDDPANLWLLAAVLLSPAASAHIAALSAGTGLSSTALRIRAADLAALRLPERSDAWSEAAAAAQAAQRAGESGRWADHRAHLETLADRMDEAQGLPPAPNALRAWWCDRIRFPVGPDRGVE